MFRRCLLLLVSLNFSAALEPRSDHAKGCRNTVQGKKFLADDKGFVCTLENLDWTTGCCKTGLSEDAPFSCRTCDAASNCCDTFEYCVSCCISPTNSQELHAAMTAASGMKSFQQAVKENDSFEFCRQACRTSSKSTIHGNAYSSPNKYCTAPVRLPRKLPDDATVVAGQQGLACSAVCENTGKVCSPEFLASVNNCDLLKKHFPCSSCESNFGYDQPAYVGNSANKEQFGKCLYNSKESFLSCAGAHADTQRLCVCRPKQR